MPYFEVRIRYEGVSVYLVDDPDAEKASEKARDLYMNGDERDNATGDAWESIKEITVNPIPAQ